MIEVLQFNVAHQPPGAMNSADSDASTQKSMTTSPGRTNENRHMDFIVIYPITGGFISEKKCADSTWCLYMCVNKKNSS